MAMANAVRMAMHADQDEYSRYIKKLKG